MKISVVIPTYNREKFLLRAIKSALDQTYSVYEILVCDDGSTDNSEKIVKSLLRSKKVKWIPGKHSGLPAVPRNRGVRMAEGNWIAFLDSDDFWRKDKIGKQVKLSQRFSIISSNAVRVEGNKNLGLALNYEKPVITFKDLLKLNFVVNSSVIIKKDLVIRAGGFNESEKFRAIEDYLLWLKVSSSENIGYINEGLTFYRDEPQDSVRKFSGTEKQQKRAVFKELLSWLWVENKLSYLPSVSIKLLKLVFI